MASEDQLAAAARSTGKVSWFSDSKGYGFITPDDEGDELFVHQTSILSEGFRSLAIGESCEFVVTLGSDGKTKAIDVTAPGGLPFGKKKVVNTRGGNRGCYNCGEEGHVARDCLVQKLADLNVGGGDKACYNCGDNGHFARDCQKVERNIGGGDKGCYTCGDSGHFARDCTKVNVGGGDRGKECYTCGGTGHIARDCATKKQRSGGCYECGGAGHLARDCDQRGSGGGGGRTVGRSSGGGNKCYNCGNEGHFARECSVASLVD